jgi:hypothetical protein
MRSTYTACSTSPNSSSAAINCGKTGPAFIKISVAKSASRRRSTVMSVSRLAGIIASRSLVMVSGVRVLAAPAAKEVIPGTNSTAMNGYLAARISAM